MDIEKLTHTCCQYILNMSDYDIHHATDKKYLKKLMPLLIQLLKQKLMADDILIVFSNIYPNDDKNIDIDVACHKVINFYIYLAQVVSKIKSVLKREHIVATTESSLTELDKTFYYDAGYDDSLKACLLNPLNYIKPI